MREACSNRRRRVVAACVALAACCMGSGNVQATSLPISWAVLQAIGQQMSTPHEGKPAGVPADFDWAAGPRPGVGNDPGGFTALTGWGQLFSSALHVAPPAVEVRDMQVFVCYGAARRWARLQHGDIEGSQFRADFKDNANTAPRRFAQRRGTATVAFEAGAAYHFWPKQGRARLPSQKLCGIVVLLRARIAPCDTAACTRTKTGRALIGLGADYWKDQHAAWDNYKTNKDVAIGRLRYVTQDWTWFGMSTATQPDLQRLSDAGYHMLGAADQE